MNQAEMNSKAQATDAALSDDQLTDVAGGVSGRIKEEFEEGLGNKRLSVSVKEEFVKDTNKDYSESDSDESSQS